MGVSAQGNNGATHVAATDTPQDCNGGGGAVMLINEGAESGANFGVTLDDIVVTAQ